MYCFDTDVLSALIRPLPPLSLVRRLARTPAAEQSTTAITVGELLYGLARSPSPALAERVRTAIASGHRVHPYDRRAASAYGTLRATLEREGRRLGNPDLQIAAICLARDLTLVTGNERHFARVPDLRVENWLL